MKIRKKLAKDIVTTLVFFITAISFILSPMTYDSNPIGSIFALTLIVGLPSLAYVIGFFRRIKLYPKEGIVEGNTLTLKYYGNREIVLSISKIEEVNMLIHSQRTAVLEFKYFDNNSAYLNVQFRRTQYSNFVDFSRILMNLESPSCSTKVQSIKNNVAKDRSEFISNFEWDEYLTEQKTVGQVLKEVIGENFLKKIITILGIMVIILSKNVTVQNLKFMAWSTLAMLFIYLITGFILRLKGFSRKESIEYFISGLLLGVIGLTSIPLMIMWIFGWNLHS